MYETIPLAPFLEGVEDALNALNHSQLKKSILNYARELPPSRRMEFFQLFIIEEQENFDDEVLEYQGDDTLISESEEFYANIIKGAYDHDIDIADPKSAPGWVDDMDVLFARADEAFLNYDYEVARRAYSVLFESLNLAEDIAMDHQLYSAQDIVLTDVSESKARYIRSLYMTFAPEESVSLIYDNLHTYQALGDNHTGIRAMRDACQTNLGGFNDFLKTWVDYLKSSVDEHDFDGFEKTRLWLLREAVLLLECPAGLEALIDEDEQVHPEVYYDLIDLFVGEEAFKEAERIVIKGLKKAEAPHIKAVLSDWLAELATRDNDLELALKARIDAWHFEPTHERLVNWCAANFGPPADEILKAEIGTLRAGPYAHDTRLICMLELLVGEYELPRRALLSVDPLGWTPVTHPGHVVYPFLLVAGAGISEIPLESSLWDVSEDMKSLFVRWQANKIGNLPHEHEVHNYLEYLFRALDRHQPTEDQQKIFLRTAHTVVLDRVRAIVTNEMEKAYENAAIMAISFAETCTLAGHKDKALRFITKLRNEYIRNNPFRSELRHFFNESSILPHMNKLGKFTEYN